MTTMQQNAALQSQVSNLVAKIEAGDEAAHEELLKLAEHTGSDFADQFGAALDRAAAAFDGQQEAVKEVEKQDALKKAQPRKAATRTEKFFSVAKVAKILAGWGKTEAATAIRGCYRAVGKRVQPDLEYILEALDGVRASRELKNTLDSIAERVASTLLELMVEKLDEANELFADARRAQGLRRQGLLNRAKAALRQGKIFFPGPGLAAIERLIKEDRLPQSVISSLPGEFLDSLKEERKPATLLLRRLTAPPERSDDRTRYTAGKKPTGLVRIGKTARDRERKRAKSQG